MVKMINYATSFGILRLVVPISVVFSGSTCYATEDNLRCNAPFSKLISNKVFRDHPVHVQMGNLRSTRPVVAVGKAHHFREVITEEAKYGPNFAGRYTIVRIGCGAATNCVAIIDTNNGHVYFPPELDTVEALLVDTGKLHVKTLNYHLDSRLLVVVGVPNEQRNRAGISYYVWRSGKLRLIKFIRAAELCGLPRSTQF